MLVAYHTGSSPDQIRDTWAWDDIEAFVACLPALRRFGHPLFGGDA